MFSQWKEREEEEWKEDVTEDNFRIKFSAFLKFDSYYLMIRGTLEADYQRNVF